MNRGANPHTQEACKFAEQPKKMAVPGSCRQACSMQVQDDDSFVAVRTYPTARAAGRSQSVFCASHTVIIVHSRLLNVWG